MLRFAKSYLIIMTTNKLNITRELLHILAKYSQWREDSIKETLIETHIRPKPANWLHFLDYIFLALGGMLFISGLFFFFAYNWAEMPKMVKLGITQVPIIALGGYLCVKKTDNLMGKIILTFMGCFIGLAFAVYGQIYQTGATAFDFLWGWTLLACIWVIISDFPPLWFLYLALLNLTLLVYISQFQHGMEMVTSSFLFLGINLLAVLLFEGLNHFNAELNTHRWFPQLVSTFILGLLTINAFSFILGEGSYREQKGAYLMLIAAIAFFSIAFFYYYQYKKEIVMVGLIPFCIICLAATYIATWFNGNDNIFMFLIVGAFVVVCCGFLISFLTKYKKHLNKLTD